MLAAARRLSAAVHETVAVHIDVDRPEPSTTALVAEISGRLPDTAVFGPLIGSVPAGRRQQIVDDFAGTAGPAVLLGHRGHQGVRMPGSVQVAGFRPPRP